MKDTSVPARYAFERETHTKETIRDRSVRGAAYLGLAGVVESGARILATILLARLLSPDEIGLIAMVLVILGLLEYIKDMGLGVVTVQQPNITHGQVSSLFWANVLLGALFAAALSGAAPALAMFYKDERVTAVTMAMSFTLLLGGASVQLEALLNRKMMQAPLAITRLIATSVSSLLAIAMAAFGASYWSLVARELARALIYLGGVWHQARWRPAPSMQLREVTRQLKLGGSLSLSFLQTAVTRQIDVILVGRIFGASAAGLYRQAQGLVVAPIEQFNAPIFGVTQPALSALQTDADLFRRYYLRMVGFVAMFTVPVGVFIATYAEEFTITALGPKWASAAPFVCAFAATMALRPTIYTTTFVLVSLGRSRPLLALETAYTVVYAALLLVASQFSAIAIAFAFVAATLILVPARLYYSFQGSPVRVIAVLHAIKVSLLAAAFMWLSSTLFKQFVHIEVPGWRLAAGALLAAVSYALPWLLLPGGRSDIKALWSHAAQWRKRRSP